MQVKVTTFNRELIGSMMKSSDIYERAVKYWKHWYNKQPDGPKDSATLELSSSAMAIKYAQDRCYDIWYNDSTGYIRDESMAFQEFRSRVIAGKELSIEGDEKKAKDIERREKQKEKSKKTMIIGAILGVVIYIIYYVVYGI